MRITSKQVAGREEIFVSPDPGPLLLPILALPVGLALVYFGQVGWALLCAFTSAAPWFTSIAETRLRIDPNTRALTVIQRSGFLMRRRLETYPHAMVKRLWFVRQGRDDALSPAWVDIGTAGIPIGSGDVTTIVRLAGILHVEPVAERPWKMVRAGPITEFKLLRPACEPLFAQLTFNSSAKLLLWDDKTYQLSSIANVWIQSEYDVKTFLTCKVGIVVAGRRKKRDRELIAWTNTAEARDFADALAHVIAASVETRPDSQFDRAGGW